jgi:hypothetical protein
MLSVINKPLMLNAIMLSVIHYTKLRVTNYLHFY